MVAPLESHFEPEVSPNVILERRFKHLNIIVSFYAQALQLLDPAH